MVFLVLVAALSGGQAVGNTAFRVLSLGGEFEPLYFDSARFNQMTPVDVLIGYISGPYESRGNTVEFYGKDAASGQAVLKAVVSIPGSIRQPLVLMREVPQTLANGTVLPYSAVVMDDSQRATPKNAIRFLNVSPFVAAISYGGDKPFILQPGQAHLIRHQPLTRSKVEPIQIAAQNEAGQWIRVGDGSLRINRDSRHMIFLTLQDIEPTEALTFRHFIVVADQRRIPAIIDQNTGEGGAD